MNLMGHQAPTLLSVKQNYVMGKINNLVPDYMAMGETGMAEMSEMSSIMDMPLPEYLADDDGYWSVWGYFNS